MHKWLNTDFVSQWYGKGQSSYDQVVQKYGAKINGQAHADPFLILYAGTPIGYIQACRISDHPDYNKYIQVDENSAGVDLFIGEHSYIHKGFGTAILAKFLAKVVFSDDSITNYVIGPEPKNKAAIRCYEKVGFQYLRTVCLPDEPELEYLMRISRTFS